jgi:hypothetical protein
MASPYGVHAISAAQAVVPAPAELARAVAQRDAASAGRLTGLL